MKNYLHDSNRVRYELYQTNEGKPYNWLFFPGGPGADSSYLRSLVDELKLPGIAEFIGFIGLNGEDQISFPAPFTPAVEVGWRIAFEYWGKGYATEGAKAALNLREIVSFTAVQNMRSRRVMERIGMHHDSRDDFDHPKLVEGHPLRRYVLYRLDTKEWQKRSAVV